MNHSARYPTGGRVVVLALFGLVAGCGAPSTGFVAGQVKFRGEPLPSGTVTFLAADGRVASAMIQGDGRYVLPRAPLGRVRISVQTFPPSPALVPPGTPPQSIPVPSLQYVALPPRYADFDQSGLVYEVKPGEQIHDVGLAP